MACMEGKVEQHGKTHWVDEREVQPQSRERQNGPDGLTEGLVVPRKPGNAGGGKRPWFRISATRGEGVEIG